MEQLDDIGIENDSSSLEEIEARAAEDRFRQDSTLLASAEKIANRYSKRKTVAFAFLCTEECERSGRKVYFIEYKNSKTGKDQKQCIEWQNRQKTPCPYKDNCELSQPRDIEE